MRLIEVHYNDVDGNLITAYVNPDHIVDVHPNICIVNHKCVRKGWHLNLTLQRYTLTDEQAQEVINRLTTTKHEERF